MTWTLSTSRLRSTDFRGLPAQQLLILPVLFRNSIQRFATPSCYAWITRVPVARTTSCHRSSASPVGHPLHFHSTSLSRQLTDSNRRSLRAEQLLHNRERAGRAPCPTPSPLQFQSKSSYPRTLPLSQPFSPASSPRADAAHKKKHKKILWAASSNCACPFFPA